MVTQMVHWVGLLYGGGEEWEGKEEEEEEEEEAGEEGEGEAQVGLVKKTLTLQSNALTTIRRNNWRHDWLWEFIQKQTFPGALHQLCCCSMLAIQI
jgi:hypothetical protein